MILPPSYRVVMPDGRIVQLQELGLVARQRVERDVIRAKHKTPPDQRKAQRCRQLLLLSKDHGRITVPADLPTIAQRLHDIYGTWGAVEGVSRTALRRVARKERGSVLVSTAKAIYSAADGLKIE